MKNQQAQPGMDVSLVIHVIVRRNHKTTEQQHPSQVTEVERMRTFKPQSKIHRNNRSTKGQHPKPINKLWRIATFQELRKECRNNGRTKRKHPQQVIEMQSITTIQQLQKIGKDNENINVQEVTSTKQLRKINKNNGTSKRQHPKAQKVANLQVHRKRSGSNTWIELEIKIVIQPQDKQQKVRNNYNRPVSNSRVPVVEP
jgi:hypothetical protein